MNSKTVYILIGPNGSGKSFIGVLMEQYFNVKFIRVESWVKEIRNERPIDDETYLKEAFQVIETVIRSAIAQYTKIVFESTGLTVYFDKMLENLRKDFR